MQSLSTQVDLVHYASILFYNAMHVNYRPKLKAKLTAFVITNTPIFKRQKKIIDYSSRWRLNIMVAVGA